MSTVDTPIAAAIDIAPAIAKARILSVSANPGDHTGLNRMIDHTVWQLARARTCRSALHQIDRNFAVVFAECDLPDGTWKDILIHISRVAAPPQLVVTSRL